MSEPITTDAPCTCETAGWCPVAGFRTTAREFQLCRTRPDYRAAFRADDCPQRKTRGLDEGKRTAVPPAPEPAEPLGLGDVVERALSAIGITSDRVSAWIGQPCGCAERKAKLNRLGRWAAGILAGKATAGELDALIAEPVPADAGGNAHV